MVKVSFLNSGLSVLVMLALPLLTGLSLPSFSAGVQAIDQASDHPCGAWSAPSHPALESMQACGEPPISRRLGEVCTEVRWLCAEKSIEAWLDQLMTHSRADWFIHRLDQGLVLAQWPKTGDASMALFWRPESPSTPPQPSGVRIMVSRFQAIHGAALDR